MTTPNDPGAFIRDLIGQFTQFPKGGANDVGGDAFAQAMGGATGAAAGAQAGMTQFVGRALSAANLPTRVELEELSTRVGRIEASLFRIEAMLTEMRDAPTQTGIEPPLNG